MHNPYEYILRESYSKHKTDTYGPFELWWVGRAGGSHHFEVKKGGVTIPFNDSYEAEQYIGRNGGLAYLLQDYFKDFWNNGFGDFVTSHGGMDKLTKRSVEMYLKDAIEMYKNTGDSQGMAQAKRMMQFLSRFP
jgi:hypothetical protein